MTSKKLCLLEIPIIDLSKDPVTPSWSSWKSSCDEVRRALEDYGCFMVTYDVVTSEIQKSVFASVESLFDDVPRETKVKNTSDKPMHGYFRGASVLPIQEALVIEDPQILSTTQSFANLMWPQGNAKFCESVYTYSKLITEMEVLLKSMIFEGYGVKHYFESHMESNYYLLRLIKYRVPNKGESNVGSSPHTDKSFITILHQNKVRGLEVKTKDGRWIAVDPSPSSFLVVAGEAAMAWSNGRIHSVVHRVVVSEEKDRYSIGMFTFSNGTIRVPEELVDDQNHPRRFNSFDHLGMLRFFASSVEATKIGAVSVKSYCGVDV